MASLTVQVERCKGTDMCLVRSRVSDAPETDKDVLRPIDYNLFERTCVPADYRLRAGALVALMLHFQKRDVLVVELRAFGNGPLWMAEAQIDECGEGDVYRRGVGATPVDALASLAVDVQLY